MLFNERYILEAIEAHELLGEFELAKALRKKLLACKLKEYPDLTVQVLKNQFFVHCLVKSNLQWRTLKLQILTKKVKL